MTTHLQVALNKAQFKFGKDSKQALEATIRLCEAIIKDDDTPFLDKAAAKARKRSCQDMIVAAKLPGGLSIGQEVKEDNVVNAPNLFGDLAVVTDQDTGEVKAEETPQPEARIVESSAAPLVVKSKSHMERLLKERSALGAELGLVMEQYAEIIGALENDLKQFDERWKEPLKEWALSNPPTKGKSIKTLWGDLVFRDSPESVSLDDENDADGTRFQGWLHSLNPEVKEQFGVKPLTTYTRNLESIKSYYLRIVHRAQETEGPMPVIPGLAYKQAEANKFSISPSIDTLRKKIKDRIKAKEQH